MYCFLLLSDQNFQRGEEWLRRSWILSSLRVLLCIIFSQTILLVLILWSQPIKHFIPHWLDGIGGNILLGEYGHSWRCYQTSPVVQPPSLFLEFRRIWTFLKINQSLIEVLKLSMSGFVIVIKPKHPLPNIQHIFLIYSQMLLDFIPAFGVYD